MVISNMDIWFTYYKLLKAYPKLLPKKYCSRNAAVQPWGFIGE